MMWFFQHFWIFISYHIFLLNQVEGAIAIPPSNRAPLPLFCPSVCPSVCPSIGLLTTFSGFCTFADKSLGRNGIELEMQMFPDDLPLANIDADGYCCHFMRSSVRPTIHGLGFVYCIQSAWKKWPTIWHADVSRWLTLSIHGCLWILLLVCLSVHLSVCSFTAFSGGCAFLAATKQLYKWYFPSVCLSVCPSVCPSVTPFWLYSHHRIIMQISGVINSNRSDVHAKGQGQRSKVKVTEVTTQLYRFRTVTPVWIHVWWWNDAYSLIMLRRGALLFFKVICQISRSHGSKNRRIWPRLGVSGL